MDSAFGVGQPLNDNSVADLVSLTGEAHASLLAT